MDFSKITTNDLISAYKNGTLQLSKTEVRGLQKTMDEAIQNANVKTAVNTILASLLFDDKQTFETLRRKDSLRYSSYINKECKVKGIVGTLLEVLPTVSYNQKENIDFLKSIYQLAPTLAVLRALKAKIVAEVKRFRSKYPERSLIKTLMSYNDFLFLKDHQTTDYSDPSKISGRAKEEIASAVSFLIFIISEIAPLSAVDGKRIADEYVSSPAIESLILRACSILDLKDIEIQVAHFNYSISKTGKDIFVNAPSENFEKSLRLGFIRASMQYDNDRLSMANDQGAIESMSIEKLANDLLNLENANFFKFKADPNYMRYALEIPENVMKIIIDDFIVPDTFFKEDYFYLSHFFKEQMIDLDVIKKLKIKGNLTAYDFLKIQRFFTLLQHMFSRKMLNNPDVPDELIYRSNIPVFTEDQLYHMLEMFIPKSHIADFLDIVTWEETDQKLLDIQYHPFIWIDDFFLLSLSVLAMGNTLRNLYALEYKNNNPNLMADGKLDPIATLLTTVFSAKGYSTASSIDYERKTDIDFMVVIDDTLIICECKQSLLPTSIHDLRTPYDYIKKAEKQLDIYNVDFEKGVLFSNINKKNVIDLTGVTKLISCVVTSNKMFIGNEFKYPIRNINELEHFVSVGNINTNEGEFNTWIGNDFSLADLENYLSDFELLKVMYDSLEQFKLVRKFDDLSIHETSYMLPVVSAREKISELTKKYKKIP